MPSVTWLDVLMVAMLVGASVATDLVAPEFLNVVLPVCAAVLIVYVWVTRSRRT